MSDRSDVVDKLLQLFHTWGWEAGSEKLRDRLDTATDAFEIRAVKALFQAWLATERGEFDQIPAHLQAMAQVPALAGWSAFIRGFVALRRRQYQDAARFLDEAAAAGPADEMRRAAVMHLRGALLFHRGEPRRALAELKSALELLPVGNFAVSRVLDTFGMVYASLGNFDAAQQFFQRSLTLKQEQRDTAGEALTHGQLGRLFLDWGLLPQARSHFEADLRLCKEADDKRGQIQMYNALGRLALAAENKAESAEWLDAGVAAAAVQPGWEVLEGFCRVDRALVHLSAVAADDLLEAEAQLTNAQHRFQVLPEPFLEGLAHANRAFGILHRLRGDYDASRQRLRDALTYFRRHDEFAEAARTQLELARTLRATGETGAPAAQAIRDALATAERSRHTEVVRLIERELKAVDPAAYYARLHERSRGRGVTADPTSLISGVRETASVMFLDVQGSTVFTRDHDPAEVMLTLNQMMAVLGDVLRRHDVKVTMFRGDGFMAVVRGEYHARRAVDTALELTAAMTEFNEPRHILKLSAFATRIGISTGQVCFGNAGTYDKLDFTAVGKAVNLGARLEPHATPGLPCISRATHDDVGDDFAYVDAAGREVSAKGFDPPTVRVWDVCARSAK